MISTPSHNGRDGKEMSGWQRVVAFVQERWFLVVALIFMVLWLSPIIFTYGKVGIYDWDVTMHRFEAIRKTVIQFHQWPGNNPWINGGQPLLGNPSVSLISIKGIMVLVFGTYWGLRFSILAYYLLGLFGAWKISRLWWDSRLTRLLFSIYTVANVAMAYHTAVGHLVFQSFWFLPLVFYYLLRFRDDRWAGLKAAIVCGFAFNDSPLYMVQYGLLIIGLFLLYFFIRHKAEIRSKIVRWALLFSPLFGLTISYRLATILEVLKDFPRVSSHHFHYSWLEMAKSFLLPYPYAVRGLAYCFSPSEMGAYLGILAFSVFVYGLSRGIRWVHVVTFFLFWMGLGNDAYGYPLYWIQKLPLFSSNLCFFRVRSLTVFFFGVATFWGYGHLWNACKNYRSKFGQILVVCLGIVMVAEVLLTSYFVMWSSHVSAPFPIAARADFPFRNIDTLYPSVSTPVPVHPVLVPLINALHLQPGKIVNVTSTFQAIQLNYGWLAGLGDPYLPDASQVIGHNNPAYIAEYRQGKRPVQPTSWSPNSISFRNLDAHRVLTLNMNPGRAWFNNGKPLFPDYPITAAEKVFVVQPNNDGAVDLYYRHPGQTMGIAGMAILLPIVLFSIFYFSKSPFLDSFTGNQAK